MPRAKTPSFIAEFPLRTSPSDQRRLAIRLETARQIYNACLSEALLRIRKIWRMPAWPLAVKLPKTVRGKPNKERSERIKACLAAHGFSEYDLQKFAERCRDDCWIGDHLGSHDTQTTARRAFKAVADHAFKKRGKPRFKSFRRLNSVEGKSVDAVIRYRVVDGHHLILWAGLALPMLLDPRDKDGWQEKALACKTKFVRIIRRSIRGKPRWYAQLVQEGDAPQKERHKIGDDVVGLDIGPSTIAAVSEDQASLETFCPTVDNPAAEIRRIQRAMDRSRRATNPNNYHANGTVKKGKRRWAKSRRYIKLARRRFEIERRLAAQRKRSHGELANRLLAMGNIIKTEDVSYKSFQRNFGRSVNRRAPGMLVSILRRKAASAGAEVIEFKTWNTRLSQFDHTTGDYIKKPLKQRWHVLGDGSGKVQRDLYSAWLARAVHRDCLDASQLSESWAAAEPLLRRAASRHTTQSTSGSGRRQRRSGSQVPQKPRLRADRSLKRASDRHEAAGTIAQAIPTENTGGQLRTPWL